MKIKVEQADNLWIISEEQFCNYGDGVTLEEAIADFVQSCFEFESLLSNRAVHSIATIKMLENFNRYVVPVIPCKTMRKHARKLAKRGYSVIITSGETTTGESICTARNPELPGCMGQGSTPEKAEFNLSLARIDYIYSLLEDGLPVPEPQSLTNQTVTINLSQWRT